MGDDQRKETASIKIRPAEIGDLGQIISRHGILYHKEYGFDATFENYVLEGLARFINNYDSALDGIWVSDVNGYPVGYIAIMHVNMDSSQLRWFLVEPEFRNLGLGKVLMQTAVDFCKPRFKDVFLWTLSSLDAARHLYKVFGFQLVEKNTHQQWGKELTEEKWKLEL